MESQAERCVILLSIPGLRSQDLAATPRLTAALGHQAPLVSSFPCVTWPVQANMLTGRQPREHGVVANGFYWRDRQEVEMWTADNRRIEAPQIWDLLHQRGPDWSSAAWFPMLSKGCGADYVCMPAPVHHPDGSEELWCYTKPSALYGELRDALGHFPLQHFWGPLADIQSTRWIVDSAVFVARRYRPRFFYIYVPHLEYAAQKLGPDSPAARAALGELDQTLGLLIDGLREAYGARELVWLAASEYVITEVDHVSYPNRILREEGHLQVQEDGGREQLDFARSAAWAMVDHQFSHVFVRDGDPGVIDRIARRLAGEPGIAEVLFGPQRGKYAVDHPRAGDLVLISEPTSWQAYYWWFDDARAPAYARTVDIHRKPGYDPVELHFDPATRSIPLDATLVRGSHGVPVTDAARQGVLLSSHVEALAVSAGIRDVDVATLVLRQWDR